MKLVVASGKGGVGKSMLASSLAILFSQRNRVVACDCDADAPNLGLWLGIRDWDEVKRISTSEKAWIDEKKCIKCGKCFENCRFSAVEKDEKYWINQLICEGCGVCKLVCPKDAVKFKKVENGEVRVKKTRFGFPLVSGQLYPGESGSGKIVQEIRNRAEEFDYDIMILDSAAGMGCPVIASLRGCDFCLLVTEPTPSGVEDLKRILKLVEYFKIEYRIVVNKWDINKEMSEKIEREFEGRLIGRISYDKKVIQAIVKLQPVLLTDSKVKKEIEEIFLKFLNFL